MASGVTDESERAAVRPMVQRRRGVILLLIAAWNVWLWGTRIRNLVVDAGDFSTAFVGVHAVLYGVSLVLAGVLAVLGARMWREGRRSAPR